MVVSVLITKVFVFLCCINVVVLLWVLVPDKRLEAVWPCFIAAFFLSLDVCSTYFVTWLSCVIWLTWSRTASKLLSEMFCDFRRFWALGDNFTSMLVAAEVFTDLHNSFLITGDFKGVWESDEYRYHCCSGFSFRDVIYSVTAVQVRRNVFFIQLSVPDFDY